MNLTTILSNLGLGDGTGNVSSMRVVLYLVVVAILLPATVEAVKTGTPLNLTAQELELLGMALGGKIIQNQQESSSGGQLAGNTPPLKPAQPTNPPTA